MTLVQWLAAQDFTIRRGDCTPYYDDGTPAEARSGKAMRRLPATKTNWDADKVYRQLVILISFSDTDFTPDDPQQYYDDMLNKPGYNLGAGPSCMADYFREQSNGLLNMQFDVYGPYKVDTKAQPYENPNANTHNYGRDAMTKATQMFIDEHPDLDFSPYDWDGNKNVEQVIYVAAGYSGNVGSEKCYGHIWPNTSTMSSITTPDGYAISNYSLSCELWPTNRSCGIGTICHEFSHSLGLPDIYPTTGWTFSIVDEWDLMDGGNFTNNGWCPPNYTPLEKMLLGWLKPTELAEPTVIMDMRPLSDGGEAYKVSHTNTEYLLLENRQWTGWDAGLPGQGLVIYHVNYMASKWSSNSVNNLANQVNFSILSADGLDYNQWESLIIERKTTSYYQNSGKMHRWMLSSAAYPWYTDSTDFVNNSLTDTSVPNDSMINKNANGSYHLMKPITNISMYDGRISFAFMSESVTLGIEQTVDSRPDNVYDLHGRLVSTGDTPKACPLRKGIYIRNGRKYIVGR